VTLALTLAGCATFPDSGPRDWREKVEGQGELGGPPSIPESTPPPAPPGQGGAPPQGGPAPGPTGCEDPDPQVVATCLEPVGAIAVLPDGQTALVGERDTGRVLRVAPDAEPELVTTLEVDAAGGGGLTGLVLSPAFDEDQLVYAYTTTAQDNRVVRIAPGDVPEPVLTGIPRGATGNSGALGVDPTGRLVVATGAAGGAGGLAGAVLRVDTLGRPAPDNPDPASPVFATGLSAPGGVCTDPLQGATWVTDRAAGADVLHRLTPGPLGPAAWRWPDRPGTAGCAAVDGTVAVALSGGAALSVLSPTPDGGFLGEPQTVLTGTYGRLAAAAPGPDGLVWLGTVNKIPGGEPVSSDDRVVRLLPPSGGGASRA
jgi:glucose/arabinose dehydrogenase